MSKKEVRVVPWKYIITLQIVIAASAINYTVTSTQYVVPYAPFFAQTTMQLSRDQVGFAAGTLAAGYACGRAIATPFWVVLADLCGRRAVLSMCFMFSLVLTMFFGLCSTLSTAVVVRFCLGLFSPVFALAHSLLTELSSPCMEQLPAVALVTTANTVLSNAAGMALGAVFATPQTEVNKFAYLASSLISAAVILVAFIVFFVDFPETLPLADVLKTAAKQAEKAHNGPQAPGKYAELTETYITEEGKQEVKAEVLTERKEKPEDEEEIPSYLAHFDSMEDSSGDRGEKTATVRPDRFFSPRVSKAPCLSLRKWPNTARAGTSNIDEDEPKEPTNLPQQSSAVGDCSKSMDNEELKRTHISFFEEDFTAAVQTSPQQIHTQQRLDDPYRRKSGQSLWRVTAFRIALIAHFCILVFAVSVKEASTVWLVAATPGIALSVQSLGAVLVGSSVIPQVLSAFLASQLMHRCALNRGVVVCCFCLAMLTMVLPLSDFVQQRELRVAVGVCALSAFECCFCVLQSLQILRISDAVAPCDRESALRWSAGSSSIAKALAALLGPSLLSCALTDGISLDYHFLYTAAGGALVAMCAFLQWSRRCFPRFEQCPYSL